MVIYTYIHTYIQYIRTYIHVYIYIYMYMYVYSHVHIHIQIYIYIYTKTYTDTDTHTHTYTYTYNQTTHAYFKFGILPRRDWTTTPSAPPPHPPTHPRTDHRVLGCTFKGRYPNAALIWPLYCFISPKETPQNSLQTPAYNPKGTTPNP